MIRRCAFMLLLLASPAAAAADEPSPDPVKPGEFIPASPAQPAPAVSLTDREGRPVSLAEFKGKLILVNLWATWCQPCLREMPSLERLQQSMGQNLAVLAISEDHGGAKAVDPFVAKLGLDALRILLDPTSEVGRAFAVRGLPTSVVIDEAGAVQGKVEGAAEWDSAKMLAVLKPLLPADPLTQPVKASAR